MRDELLDIVRAITVVPFDKVKVKGENGEVVIQSKLEDDANGAVIFRGKLSKPNTEIDGVFGLSDIGLLSGLTNLEAYRDKAAKISIKYLERNGVKIPEEIVFEKDNFAKSSYRLTGEKQIPAQLKETGKIIWNVELGQPNSQKITELAQIAGIYSSQETKFTIKTENRQLKFLIGDENASTHKSAFIFADNVQGTIKPNHSWSLTGMLNVLKFGNKGTTTLKISEQGILQVEVDTGLGVYTYMLAGAN